MLFRSEQKLAAVAEASQPGMSISFVARRDGISPSLLFGWRRRITEGGKEAVRVDDKVVADAEGRALEKRIRELERVLGKKTLENEILREGNRVVPATWRPRVEPAMLCVHAPEIEGKRLGRTALTLAA